MNFRQRLTNVLTVLFCGGFWAWLALYLTFAYDPLKYVGVVEVIATLVCGAILHVIPMGISFLMGTGFKAWHKDEPND